MYLKMLQYGSSASRNMVGEFPSATLGDHWDHLSNRLTRLRKEGEERERLFQVCRNIGFSGLDARVNDLVMMGGLLQTEYKPTGSLGLLYFLLFILFHAVRKVGKYRSGS